MEISVAICTWNRCELLRQALEQMTRLAVPQGVEWELLVVNNNCTDATDQVIESFAPRLPLRRLFEPQQGQSNARNCAVREASGDYILWTDDDVLVDDQWIAEYHGAFNRWPDAAIFGGPIEPWFAGIPPRWLQQTLPTVANAYAARGLGEEPVSFSPSFLPFGANFAVRTKDQVRYLYNPRLGLAPGSNMRMDETTVIQAMLAAGFKGRWVPRARVRHYIPKKRQRTRYLRDYFFGQGEYAGLQMRDNGEPKLFGRPRWLWRRAIEAEVRYCLHRFLCRPEVWIEDLKIASHARGVLCGYASRRSNVGSRLPESTC